jgi:hypothetical protein
MILYQGYYIFQGLRNKRVDQDLVLTPPQPPTTTSTTVPTPITTLSSGFDPGFASHFAKVANNFANIVDQYNVDQILVVGPIKQLFY